MPKKNIRQRRRKLNRQVAYGERHAAHGLCISCPNPAGGKYSRCLTCREKRREAAKLAMRVRRSADRAGF